MVKQLHLNDAIVHIKVSRNDCAMARSNTIFSFSFYNLYGIILINAHMATIFHAHHICIHHSKEKERISVECSAKRSFKSTWCSLKREHEESETNIIYSICLITLHQWMILFSPCIRSKSIYRLNVHIIILCYDIYQSLYTPSFPHILIALSVILWWKMKGIQINGIFWCVFFVCVRERTFRKSK